MDGPGDYYVKWNKPIRERHIPYDFPYMWNLMDKINKQNRTRLIGTENRLTPVREKGDWRTGWKTKRLSKKPPQNS